MLTGKLHFEVYIMMLAVGIGEVIASTSMNSEALKTLRYPFAFDDDYGENPVKVDGPDFLLCAAYSQHRFLDQPLVKDNSRSR
jgi:hypothetical protein